MAAVHFIISSAAKYDTEDKVLIQEIQQLGLPKENSDTVAKQYRENKDALRDQLQRDSYRLSRLVECNWRVDQILAQSDPKDASKLVTEKNVNLRLVVDSRPGVPSEHTVKDIGFEISPQNLDLLILELSQAQQMMSELDA